MLVYYFTFFIIFIIFLIIFLIIRDLFAEHYSSIIGEYIADKIKITSKINAQINESNQNKKNYKTQKVVKSIFIFLCTFILFNIILIILTKFISFLLNISNNEAIYIYIFLLNLIFGIFIFLIFFFKNKKSKTLQVLFVIATLLIIISISLLMIYIKNFLILYFLLEKIHFFQYFSKQDAMILCAKSINILFSYIQICIIIPILNDLYVINHQNKFRFKIELIFVILIIYFFCTKRIRWSYASYDWLIVICTIFIVPPLYVIKQRNQESITQFFIKLGMPIYSIILWDKIVRLKYNSIANPFLEPLIIICTIVLFAYFLILYKKSNLTYLQIISLIFLYVLLITLFFPAIGP